MELLTLAEIAEALKISRTTLYRIRRDNDGFPRGVRIRSRYRWHLNEVRAYLERNRETYEETGYLVSERFANPRRPYNRLRAVS